MSAPRYSRKVLSLLALITWFFPFALEAEVIISEIMYDLSGSDTDREWVEIYNAGSSSVTIVPGSVNGSWRFVDSSPHVLNLANGSADLAPGQYAIIARNSSQFLTEWSAYAGTLFTSAISLSNTGSTLALRDGSGNTIGQVPYTSELGANGDGNSLQKNPSGWIAAAPTPGTANSETPITNNDSASNTTNQNISSNNASSNQTSNTTSSHFSSAPLSNTKPASAFAVSAGRARLGTVGSPMEFRVEVASSGQSRDFNWSMGDGTTKSGSVITHAYSYPGEYVVVLNAEGISGNAVSRTSVKIIEAELSVTHASAERIELTNNSSSEINLHGRAIVVQGKMFIFPQDTIILAKHKVSFASQITGLKPVSATDVYLVISGNDPSRALAEIKINEELESQRLQEIAAIQGELQAVQQRLAMVAEREKLAQKPAISDLVQQDKSAPVEIEEVAVALQTALVLDAAEDTKPSKFGNWLRDIKHFFIREER